MDTIKTEVIVEAKYFQELGTMSIFKDKETGEPLKQKLTDREIYMKLYGLSEVSGIDEEVGKKTELTTLGLTLPGNVLIIGTVNMDDTTHQFSRKVIDRAMTIEMNGGKCLRVGSQKVNCPIEITTNGLGAILADSLQAPEVSISANGAGSVRTRGIATSKLSVKSNGAGEVVLAGRCETARVEINGAGLLDVRSLDVTSKSLQLESAGVGKVLR